MPDRIAIGYVRPLEVAASFHESMMAMFEHLIMSGVAGRFIPQRFLSGGGLPQSRNNVVRAFLETGDDWLLWLDTDMGFGPDTATRLLEVADKDDAPIVGALCFSNVEVAEDGMGGYATFPIPTIYKWAKQPDGTTGFVSWHDYPRDELYRCDATGSACIIIHRTVFERMRDKHDENWYTQIPNPNGGIFGEDMSFCVQAAEVGFPIHVHTGIKTTHQKPIWLSEVHFDMHRQNAAAHGIDSQVAAGGARPRKMNRAERRAAAKAS